jgi:hemerythrin
MPLPSNLVTGQALIDEQHANILSFVERLIREDSDIRIAINVVLEHFTSHFGEEEKLMESIDYPDLWEHRREHINFFDVFVNLRAKFDMAPTEDNRRAFIDGINRWVERHILTEDVKIVDFIKSKTEANRPNEEP